jgi:PAS domain S-box-containing protein
MQTIVNTTTTTNLSQQPLPKTLVQAMQPSSRAVVIVESTPPYRVFNVNCAWQKLCGYSLTEARHHTLCSLLTNSEINSVKAKDLVQQLMTEQAEEVEATIVNYKKCGRRYVDHVRVGPLRNKQGKVTHFVGVVEEVVTTPSS